MTSKEIMAMMVMIIIIIIVAKKLTFIQLRVINKDLIGIPVHLCLADNANRLTKLHFLVAF